MAVNPSDLKIIIRETITLNNNKYDSRVSQTISNIKEVTKKIITIPTSSQEIISVSGSIGSAFSNLKTEDVKYMRLSNLNTANNPNHVDLTFRNFDNDEFKIKLDYNKSFLYPGDTLSGVSGSMDASQTEITDNDLASLTKVIAQASGSEVDMEIFIAST